MIRLLEKTLFLFLLIIFCFSFFLSAQPKKKTMHSHATMSDDALLDLTEKQTFEFFWNGAEPNSGMAPERIHMDNIYPENDQSTIATGGSGFGCMAILAGIHRRYITRSQGFQRFEKIVS